METWIEIPNSQYKVSDLGRVKSLKKILKCSVSKGGYGTVNIYHANGANKLWYIHILVAQAFISNPEKKRTVNHKDGNKLNNQVSNLEWATYSENHLHAYSVLKRMRPTPKKGAASPFSQKVAQYAVGGGLIETHSCGIQELIRRGYSKNIYSCLSGKRNKASGFVWRRVSG